MSVRCMEPVLRSVRTLREAMTVSVLLGTGRWAMAACVRLRVRAIFL